MMEETRGQGAYSPMSDAWPKVITLPAFAAAAWGAVESVCWRTTSAPCSISAFAASASFGSQTDSIEHEAMFKMNGKIFAGWSDPIYLVRSTRRSSSLTEMSAASIAEFMTSLFYCSYNNMTSYPRISGLILPTTTKISSENWRHLQELFFRCLFSISRLIHS